MLLFEQQDRLVATIKFIYAGIYKKRKKKGDYKEILSKISHQLELNFP